MSIEQSVNKALKQVDFRSFCSGNVSGSGGVSSVKSYVNHHKFCKKGNIKKDFRPNEKRYSGNPPKKSANDLPECVTNKPIFSDNKDLATPPMTLKNNKYKCCTSCNNVKGAWGFHWKDGHKE